MFLEKSLCENKDDLLAVSSNLRNYANWLLDLVGVLLFTYVKAGLYLNGERTNRYSFMATLTGRSECSRLVLEVKSCGARHAERQLEN